MIRVHGYLGQSSQALRDEAATANLVVGGRRHLDALEVPEERRIVLGALSTAVPKIVEAGDDARIVVIASGDPGLFGIVRRLRAAGLDLEVVPEPSSVAAAFAAAGLPWDDAEVVSVHGRDLAPGLAVCRAWGKVAVMTGPDQGIRELAAGLADLRRTYWLCERLGETDQRVRLLTGAEALELDDIAQPNVVLVLDPALTGSVGWRLGAPRPEAPLPQVDDEAARIFCRLLPRLGDTLWVRGGTGRQVGELARHNGAAVVDLDENPTPPGTPTWTIDEGVLS
ncbi:Cobalt-precorrin-6y C5-methyltransferase / Cobalt-precorrin-6y C15-methyltransferase [decarboxylating] [Luteococcus japonicus LSP_Lj1]|uniref:Cobalt-precorrin-6y C5-methyltransferase / Cobalt-precorrin-6y C15-methyltransferase [decarboxylating] n=1 Tax=Luteococcus japonicus LSP_Lj1 TaxID=1255658 RepID=A0A1R4K9S1_9ACTN|nr:precorrin-6y C5,15-methyltransferase (decarboxylating) subunit CbiE [Luteococcus japonicus]SJN40763.1 Cobalt-precorrin-6y C5-methyltransferase / Cobalt-precorrin-6y C15-methyltransferase [decarboxylating] [Luteococcus japonicus LSP_Lj1]